MKTETAIVLVVLIIGGVAAYKIFAKQQTTTANTPLGANIGTLNAAANIASAIPSFIGSIENAFTGHSSNASGGGISLTPSDLTPVTIGSDGTDSSFDPTTSDYYA